MTLDHKQAAKIAGGLTTRRVGGEAFRRQRL